MSKKEDIPARTKKLIIQESAGVCSFCRESDVSTLEFHHIHGKEIPQPHAPENLIYVCKNCHGKITAGVLSESDVDLQKRRLKYSGASNTNAGSKVQLVNVSGGVNKGAIASEIHFHGAARSSIKIFHPIGTIGSDALRRNYLKHLIDRYHEFAKSEKGEAYKYTVFYQTLKRRYAAKWDMIPLHLFEDVCAYVHRRIDGTVLGRNRKAGKQTNYSDFSTYCEKYTRRGRTSQ